MYNTYETYSGDGGGGRYRRPPEGRKDKDPHIVLGVSPGASQSQIKAAYRHLAMKYHPDRCNGQGDAAKKRATAKFAEISAAYEILSCDGNSSGASHPSFANVAPSYTAAQPHPYATYQSTSGIDPFATFDVFGFGTFGSHFTDPFELFQQTFGDLGANGENMMGAFPTSFTTNFGSSPLFSTAMYAPTFNGLAGGSNGSTYYSSSNTYSVGGGGSYSTASRMISTTTTVVNGKTETRQIETVVNPDGTTTLKTIGSTGDTNVPQNRRIENVPSKSSQAMKKKRSRRRYKIETKQHIAKFHPKRTQHARMPSNEVYIVDSTGADKSVIDLTNDDDSDVRLDVHLAEKGSKPVDSNHSQRTRKRKFCEVMSKYFMCCFHITIKTKEN